MYVVNNGNRKHKCLQFGLNRKHKCLQFGLNRKHINHTKHNIYNL